MTDFNRTLAHVYVWQMNDGRWHVSAMFFNQKQSSETEMELHKGGFDGGFETRKEAEAALAQWRVGAA